MKKEQTYIIKADRETKEIGTVWFKVVANSEEEAISKIESGEYTEEVDWNVKNSESSDSNYKAVKNTDI